MIIKEDIDSGGAVSLTFVLPSDIKAHSAHLVGSLNDWDKSSLPMELDAETETWRIRVQVVKGLRIEFRYLVDGETWINDWNADEYVANPFGGVNSVVSIQ